MKILMLADKMDIGGAETHIYELSRSLFSLGHEIRIFSGGGRTADLLKGNAVISDFCHAEASLFRGVSSLLSLIKEFKPDVVHAHTRRGLFLARAALSIAPFPLVFTAHAKFSTSLLKRIFTLLPQHTIAVSRDVKEHLTRYFSPGSITVIANGIDVERFRPSPALCGGLSILNVSRLDRDCSLTAELLCRIAPRLLALYPKAKITLVGGGNDARRIADLADGVNAAAGRRAVICAGAQADVAPYLASSNLFVGVSRAALEAMSCGLTTVICGSEGFWGLCKRGDVKELEKENFCARGRAKPSEELLFRHILLGIGFMGSEETDLSAEIRKSFSAETSAKKTLEVYGRAIADHRDRRRFDAVVCGYYGFGNLGDELVLHSILSRTKGLRVGVIGARGGGRIWRFDPIGVCRALRSSGLFIFGGGTLLQNATSNRSLSYYLWVLRAAAFFGRPVALFASGVGPIIGRGARERCALALMAADYAGLRDEGSLRLARTLAGDLPRFRLSADPALVPRQGGETKGLIGVFVRGEDASPRLSEALISALSIVAKTYGYRVCFASMNRKRDRGAARELKKRFGAGAELWEADSREELFDLISSCALVVSARLHALITAASFARPFVGICSDPKVGYFVKECALPPIFSVFPESKSLEKDFETALSEAVEHSGELSERIKTSVEKLYRRAEPDLLCALRLMK